jgi:glycosyltransferase involved in cell wall biosynthesis
MSKKVLMICYHYLPANNAGVKRNKAVVEKLPLYGWEPTVITTNILGGETKNGIIRTPEFTDRNLGYLNDLHRLMRIPDAQMEWIPYALKPSRGLLRNNGADVIYTTSPPVSSHLLGLALKKLSGRPWVMDLRDPWTFEPLSDSLRKAGLRLTFEKKLESLCFRNADTIVINTTETAEHYKSLYPGYAVKMRTIASGFDQDEIKRAQNQPSPWSPDLFVMTHMGNFCRRTDRDMTPDGLLEALKALSDSNTISQENFRAVLAGSIQNKTEEIISAYGLDELVELPGLLPYSDAMKLLVHSDMLLLYDPEDDGRTYVRSKLYEYIASGKKILGIVPKGATRNLIDRSGLGMTVHPSDVKGIEQAVSAAMRSKSAPSPGADLDPSIYEWKRLTKELADCLNEISR